MKICSRLDYFGFTNFLPAAYICLTIISIVYFCSRLQRVTYKPLKGALLLLSHMEWLYLNNFASFQIIERVPLRAIIIPEHWIQNYDKDKNFKFVEIQIDEIDFYSYHRIFLTANIFTCRMIIKWLQVFFDFYSISQITQAGCIIQNNWVEF